MTTEDPITDLGADLTQKLDDALQGQGLTSQDLRRLGYALRDHLSNRADEEWERNEKGVWLVNRRQSLIRIDPVKVAHDDAIAEGHYKCACGAPATSGYGTLTTKTIKGQRHKVWDWLQMSCPNELVPDPDRPGSKTTACSLRWVAAGRPKRTAPQFRLRGRSPNHYAVRIEPDGTETKVVFDEGL
jgi:hypothetical protein